jgi:hypothetical protein
MSKHAHKFRECSAINTSGYAANGGGVVRADILRVFCWKDLVCACGRITKDGAALITDNSQHKPSKPLAGVEVLCVAVELEFFQLSESCTSSIVQYG